MTHRARRVYGYTAKKPSHPLSLERTFSGACVRSGPARPSQRSLTRSQTFYNEEEARDLCRVLLGAVKYIHDQGVVHRDLKPENLLLASKTDDTSIRLADFGFACNVRDRLVTDQLGTALYVAPEILCATPYGRVRVCSSTSIAFSWGEEDRG